MRRWQVRGYPQGRSYRAQRPGRWLDVVGGRAIALAIVGAWLICVTAWGLA